MIQRIQTVWLLLCAISASLAFFIPFGTEFVTKLNTENVEGVSMNAINNSVVMIATINIILCSLIALFSYKKRSVQKVFTIIVILHAILGIAFIIYTAEFQIDNRAIRFGIIAPILAFVFGSLAYRGVQKDDKLVKNLDRLR